MSIRTMIVDDEPLAIERLQMLCAREPRIALVGTASDGEAALRLIEGLKPDLVMLDIAMPLLDGIGVARAVGRPHALRPDREIERIREAAELLTRAEAGARKQGLPLADAVIAHMGRIAQHLDRVAVGVERIVLGRDAVREQEPAAGSQHAKGLGDEALDVGKVMGGQPRGHDVEARVLERQSVAVPEHVHRLLGPIQDLPQVGLLVEDRGRVLEAHVTLHHGLEDAAVGTLGDAHVQEHAAGLFTRRRAGRAHA